ncbi:MAG: hypothetical protein JWM19_773, partial [Actinomycetia bacterium]|nr:hypothetical protein [Actinomycetes bacterium]
MSTPPDQMTEDELLAVAGKAMTKAAAAAPVDRPGYPVGRVRHVLGRARAPRRPLARSEPAGAPAMTGARTMAARIADEIADWAGDQDPWTPVPPDDEVSGWLDFVASPDTVQAAKRALV